ncbi:hypothetical protein QKT26_gp45 [Carcinus maenas nudivirus]|uniref:Uncharacterized protein n=1 Tax=Carcinus maenas nudivirus TaxID=2880837 RepID=A0AAE9BZZ3_9VIRU|nr:hypothetical protein QKT26_gp45 [Carcinus maenas nudivirus]UBZ25635.1 hypothetical protein CmNV_044 [Carcinus maenas nudivirus]
MARFQYLWFLSLVASTMATVAAPIPSTEIPAPVTPKAVEAAPVTPKAAVAVTPKAVAAAVTPKAVAATPKAYYHPVDLVPLPQPLTGNCQVLDKIQDRDQAFKLPTNITIRPEIRRLFTLRVEFVHNIMPDIIEACLEMYQHGLQKLQISLYDKCQTVHRQGYLWDKVLVPEDDILMEGWTSFAIKLVGDKLQLHGVGPDGHNLIELNAPFRLMSNAIRVRVMDSVQVAIGCLVECPFKKLTKEKDDVFYIRDSMQISNMYLRPDQLFEKLKYEIVCVSWFGGMYREHIHEIDAHSVNRTTSVQVMPKYVQNPLPNNWHLVRMAHDNGMVELSIDLVPQKRQKLPCEFQYHVLKVEGGCSLNLCEPDIATLDNPQLLSKQDRNEIAIADLESSVNRNTIILIFLITACFMIFVTFIIVILIFKRLQKYKLIKKYMMKAKQSDEVLFIDPNGASSSGESIEIMDSRV